MLCILLSKYLFDLVHILSPCFLSLYRFQQIFRTNWSAFDMSKNQVTPTALVVT